MNAARSHPLTHPLTLAAATLVLVNDFALRGAAPGWLTGKLSDVGWLILVPIAIAACLSAIGVGDRRAQGAGLTVALVTFVTLQLWPPLGAWFSPSHIADAEDLLALPALLLALLVWRTSRWNTPVPAAVGAALVGGTLVADSWTDPGNATYPCDETPDWEAATPLRFSLSDIDVPSDTDAFLRAISLVDEAGDEVPFIVIWEGDPGFVLCAREGLRANTAYTWTLGPWEEQSSNEREFFHPGFEPLAVVTGSDEGVPAHDASACAELARSRPLPEDVREVCVAAHPEFLGPQDAARYRETGS